MKRVLMVAFHFPPFAGSSGVQRTLRFVQHLPSYGWEPIVLTAHPRAYEATNDDLLSDVPEGIAVERAFALDTARHLALGRRYPAALARPDRWSTWRFGAIAAGLRLIRRHQPDALWSTFPIATAHLIGGSLRRYSTLPWVADFRDPMVQDDYPPDPKTRDCWQAIEVEAVRRASACVFCTAGAARLYLQRYPDTPLERVAVIENGYDEETFAGIDDTARARGPLVPGRITLVHSGVVYSSERDPSALFTALGRLKRSGRLDARSVLIRFRASNNDGLLRSLAETEGVADLIEIAAPLAYTLALEEMLRADGLIVLQGSSCNEQIPAKLYEYIRAGRPILALTDPAGDTAAALRASGITGSIAALDSADQIETSLLEFVAAIRNGVAAVPQPAAVQRCTRMQRAKELAALLDRCGEGSSSD
jgi:hypothetical protein